MLAYTVDVATHDVVFDKPINVEPNFSFGHVSYTYNSIYFVHEVNDYDGNSNTGAVSRWTIGEGETLTKQEVTLSSMFSFTLQKTLSETKCFSKN